MRTPLHYAMGVQGVETLSKTLIEAGARRVVKDLVRIFTIPYHSFLCGRYLI